ncbi:MAG: hypothetical protein IKR18_03965 [Bacteroidaceae bacterium]|nr:hypothetical protein [Bacteroidaceae bacterium]
MGIINKIFGKKNDEAAANVVGGLEDYMTLIRVYFQSVVAANLGITNLAYLPDLRTFKHTMKVPTVNNKLGVGEKSKCKKMLVDLYGVDEILFKEIDNSVKKNCKNPRDIQNYLFKFQGFSQDLMMLMGNLMQWKFRMPSFFKSALRTMTQKSIHDVMTKMDWKDADVRKTVANVRAYANSLGFSEAWMTEYVFSIVMLAKKEPRKKQE